MKTLKIRIKDKHSKLLTKLAMEVNYVFNYSNGLSYEHLRRTGKFFSAYDLHKLSSKLVKEHSAIYIGNVNAKSLSKTKLAKSVHDAAWSSFRTMLRYKCENAKVLFKIVNEKYSTQVCSCCSCIGDSSPKGRAGLGIREWSCVYCGTVHDRDINAANNILATGHCRPVVGIHTS